MNLSLLPRYDTDRRRSDEQADKHMVAGGQQARRTPRQLRRLHWILLIAAALILLNVLATISGVATPLYSMLVPGDYLAAGIAPAAGDRRELHRCLFTRSLCSSAG